MNNSVFGKTMENLRKRINVHLVNPKRAGGGVCYGIRPLDIFWCYISAGCYFFALKLHDFFSSSLALILRPFFKKSDRGL